MVSIIIPAHNEERVIGRCLRALLDGARTDEFEIIVVCNGCNDGTAAAASAFGNAVTVIDLPASGKTLALNTGDRKARHFPRLFLDADIELSAEAVRSIARALTDGTAMAATSSIAFNMAGANFLVRSYYAVWRMHPYFKTMIGGSGCYAISEAGRRRFADSELIPAGLVTDDHYVCTRFSAGERRIVQDAVSTVTVPRTLRALLATRIRSWEGRMRQPRYVAAAPQENTRDRFGFVRRLIIRPWLYPGSVIYFGIAVVARIIAYLRARRGGDFVWLRDTTTR